MSTAVSSEKIEKRPRPAATASPTAAPVVEPVPTGEEERPLRRDHVALLFWAAGVLILLLWHVYDALLTLFAS